MQQDSPASHWSNLTTNTTFDEGVTLPADVGDGNVIINKPQRTVTSSLLVESLVEQLCKLLEPDPVQQKALYEVICGKLHSMKLIDKTYGIEEFGVIRSHYQRELMRFLNLAKSTLIKSNRLPNGLLQYSSPSLELTQSLAHQEHLSSSRYMTDFVEVEFLAKGGFGEVYRARHRLDGEDYAVKKICLCYRNKNYFMRSLREVKLLAKLNHPNIVSYKAAWLEPLSPIATIAHGGDSYKSISQAAYEISKERSINSVESEEDSDGIIFKESTSYQPRVNGKEETCDKSDDILRGSSSSERALCKFQWNEESICRESISNEWATLYIQMQLCEGTLRQWLDERNNQSLDVDIHVCLSIFRQIVSGVDYIHSQGIVHHDIKPSNVFLNKEMSHIQVGDLGLACIFQHSNQDVKFVNRSVWSLDHRGEIGTKLYAAPEQLKGDCNPKSDIYSLGIVLFELIQPFSTDMERSKLVTRLKSGDVPSQLHSSYPLLVELTKLLTSSNPALRPSARELLRRVDALLDELSVNTISSDSMSETIRQLRADLFKKDLEIEELKRKVQTLQSFR